MCDTLVATAASTETGRGLFAKNSDRERSEAQALEQHPAADHAPDESVRCAYLTIPQAAHTHAVLLCRPFWMWGAEMGVNEHGVAIGNEAMFGREPPPTGPGLTGMDLVRLGLERAASAGEAVEVLVGLLRDHGQGGDCGLVQPMHYHNGFVIADGLAAYILETLGREWVVQKVSGVRALSNAFSVVHAQRASPGAAAMAAEFAEELSRGTPVFGEDPARGSGRSRCARATQLLPWPQRKLGPGDLMEVLRDHGPQAPPRAVWRLQDRTGPSICAHATDEQPRGQTVGSLVADLGPGKFHWATASASPCVAVFKPVMLGAPVDSLGPAPTDRVDLRAYWWRSRSLEAHLLAAPADEVARFRSERDRLEAALLAEARTMEAAEAPVRARFVQESWLRAVELEDRWRTARNRPRDSDRARAQT